MEKVIEGRTFKLGEVDDMDYDVCKGCAGLESEILCVELGAECIFQDIIWKEQK